MAKRDATEAAIDELKHSKTPAAAQTEIDSLEKRLDRVMTFRPFHYTHQGSLAYIGSEKAIADLVRPPKRCAQVKYPC
jgi:NADH:ubiquinone reductase (non-electrogenic)